MQQPEPKWKQEGFRDAKHRKNKLQPFKRSLKKYLGRKGLVEEEEIIQHCIGFVNFLGGSMVRRTFSWGNYYNIAKGLRSPFAYYTKERLGWEGARVPKENYKDLFD